MHFPFSVQEWPSKDVFLGNVSATPHPAFGHLLPRKKDETSPLPERERMPVEPEARPRRDGQVRDLKQVP
jgi:hypothetical protein